MSLAHRMLGLATERLFAHLSLDETWLAQVRRAQQFGPIVYVLRNVSLLDYLAIQYLTRQVLNGQVIQERYVAQNVNNGPKLLRSSDLGQPGLVQAEMSKKSLGCQAEHAVGKRHVHKACPNRANAARGSFREAQPISGSGRPRSARA